MVYDIFNTTHATRGIHTATDVDIGAATGNYRIDRALE